MKAMITAAMVLAAVLARPVAAECLYEFDEALAVNRDAERRLETAARAESAGRTAQARQGYQDAIENLENAIRRFERLAAPDSRCQPRNRRIAASNAETARANREQAAAALRAMGCAALAAELEARVETASRHVYDTGDLAAARQAIAEAEQLIEEAAGRGDCNQDGRIAGLRNLVRQYRHSLEAGRQYRHCQAELNKLMERLKVQRREDDSAGWRRLARDARRIARQSPCNDYIGPDARRIAREAEAYAARTGG